MRQLRSRPLSRLLSYTDRLLLGNRVKCEVQIAKRLQPAQMQAQPDDGLRDFRAHGVPIFVPSHRPPGPSAANYLLVTYVTDGIERAMAQAKAAAGDRNVMLQGAYTAQRALEAGVLDEVQIHQIPVLFGGGRRLFEVLPSRIELEIVRVIDTPEATHIRYRVRR